MNILRASISNQGPGLERACLYVILRRAVLTVPAKDPVLFIVPGGI